MACISYSAITAKYCLKQHLALHDWTCQDMLDQWSMPINTDQWRNWSKIQLNKYKCQSMTINTDQYFSMLLNANQCRSMPINASFISIGYHCMEIKEALTGIENYCSILINIDQYWYLLINIVINTLNLIRYWSILIDIDHWNSMSWHVEDVKSM